MCRRRCPGGSRPRSRPESATARSVRPSSLKSAATIDVAPLPCGKATVKGCWNVPSPLPGRMVTLSEPSLTTARPRLPLPVKSPVATADVPLPTTVGDRFLEGAVAFAQEHGDVAGADVPRGQVEAAVAVEIARDDRLRRLTPPPCASRAETSRRRCPGAPRHRWHSRRRRPGRDGHCRSRPPRSSTGFAPTAIDDVRANVPSPLPCRISTTLLLESVTARSRLPVPKSPATMDVGVAAAGSSMGGRATKFPPP